MQVAQLFQPGIYKWQLYIMQGGGACQQVKRLKDETDLTVADTGKLGIGHTGCLRAVQRVAAAAGAVETANHVH